ncbi:hypothetical protein TUM4249_35500 [Shewanella sp. KT0246]|uniref:hypothetical protein n=1 Tax=uncultured Shewanella sp. TaxID=173975 RepID=UPI001BBB2F03|nr:hypothetical protein [uncultured Shewanella sp.]GIU53909.1 hypothetical protein TUM4249_35500 [Shewanella sp. KT0246]
MNVIAISSFYCIVDIICRVVDAIANINKRHSFDECALGIPLVIKSINRIPEIGIGTGLNSLKDFMITFLQGGIWSFQIQPAFG